MAESGGTYHIPSEIDGKPVTDVADDCIPEETDVIICGDKGSAAERYAQRKGYTFQPYTYTVTLVTNGGSPVERAVLCAADSVPVPASIHAGYTLTGWFTNRYLTNEWDFENDLMPRTNLTLYAGWKAEEDVVASPFTFTANDTGLTITGYNRNAMNLTIPSSINGVAVTAIGSNAFRGNETVLTLSVPGCVTHIGSAAFAQSRLDSIVLGEGVQSLGNHVFSGCSELSSVTMPDTVTQLGAYAFQDCSALTQLRLSSLLTALPVGCFSGCKTLMTVTLPASLESISSAAFESCGWLQTLNIGAKVTHVDTTAFLGCTNLTAIHVDASNKAYTSEDGVLLSLSGETLLLYPAGKEDSAYTIPHTVTTIADSAMANSRLRTLTLNEGLISIGKDALAGSISLNSIQFAENENLALIDDNAFGGCTSLTTLTLPNGLEYVGESAFGVYKLTDVTVLNEYTVLGNNAIPAWDGLILFGKSCSEAESYADYMNIRFVSESDVPVTSVTLDREQLTLAIGDAYAFVGTLTPESTTENQLVWTSSDSVIARVDENGCVTACAEGTAKIYARAANGSMAQCIVTVKKTSAMATQLRLSSEMMVLSSGDAVQLAGIVSPSESAASTLLSWVSDNEEVAIVIGGRVYALADGTAAITCTTDNGLTAVCMIAVGVVLLEPDLVLPAKLKLIGEEAFAGGAFTAVETPSGVEKIDKRAFADCANLRQISISDSVTTIEEDAFGDPIHLVILCSKGSRAQQFATEHGLEWREK